jgi:hypothetical protein
MSFLFLFHIEYNIFGVFAISDLRSDISREDCRKAENCKKADNNMTSIYNENIFG